MPTVLARTPGGAEGRRTAVAKSPLGNETGAAARRRDSAPGAALEDRDHLGHALAVDGLLAPVQAQEPLHFGIGLAVRPALIARVAVDLSTDDLRKEGRRDLVRQRDRIVRQVLRRRLERSAELDGDGAAHALGMPAFLAPVAPEEIRGVGVADAVRAPLVEVLAGSLDAKEQAHGVDVELLDRRERGG